MASAGNQAVTHQSIAREAVAMLMDDCTFTKNINRGREEEFVNARNGYMNGDSVDIAIPPVPTVYSGSVFAGGASTAPDWKEETVRLKLDIERHVPLTLTAKEKLLDMSDYKKRFLMPAMNSLKQQVEAIFLQKATALTANVLGTPGSVPDNMKLFNAANARLNKNLAPDGNRYSLITSDTNVELADSMKGIFNNSKKLDKVYDTGFVGSFYGLDFYENQSLAILQNGTAAPTALSGATADGAATLKLGGLTAGQTVNRGFSFTIPGVFMTNPLNGLPTTTLRVFVVTEDATAAGTTLDVSVYPRVKLTTASQVGTVSSLPGTGATITPIVNGNKQNLVFHGDAFTAAFAPLPVLASCEGYTATNNGFSVRVMTFGDGYQNRQHTRIDVLAGLAVVRPDHAVRITE